MELTSNAVLLWGGESGVEWHCIAPPIVHFHFTPTYSSRLNQVAIWFFKVERDVIARRIFTNVMDLALKLRPYINTNPANAKTIHWKYSVSENRNV
jgi:hypothetical protein